MFLEARSMTIICNVTWTEAWAAMSENDAIALAFKQDTFQSCTMKQSSAW